MDAEHACGVRRVFAVLIVVLLACPLLFAGLLAVPLSMAALDRHFYLGLLNDARLYQIPDATSGATWSGAATGMGPAWRYMARASRAVLTPEYLRAQALRVANQAFDCLEGRADWFDMSIDLSPVKQALRGEAGRTFARRLAEDLPVGGRADEFHTGPGQLPASRPAGISVERAAAIIFAGIPTFLGSVPDTIKVSDEPGYGRPPGARFSVAEVVTITGTALLALGAGLLVGAAFLGGRTARERAQWCGWPLLAPAVGVLLTGVAAAAGAAWIPPGIANAHLELSGVTPSFVAAVIEAARHVASHIGVALLAAGGITAGAALGLLAWSWAAPRHDGSAEVSA